MDVLFSTCRQGSSAPAEIPIPGRRGGAPVAADPGAPVIGLREVERNLQGLTMGIPPLRRREVPLHLQRHTVGVPENVNSLLRRVVRAVICYSQHNAVQGD
jgi:hypothetical protein